MRNTSDQYRRFHLRFRAMGTNVDVWLWRRDEETARNALHDVQRFFARTEARLSRFQAGSELSQLNRAAGSPFLASPFLFERVREALAWRARTGGLFDPTILPALVSAGYDRSFALLLEETTCETSGAEQPHASHGEAALPWRSRADEIRMGPGTYITLPQGAAIDLGGIAKGWTAQQAANRLASRGPCLVDAGGDLVGVGAPPDEPWVVTVADPWQPERTIATLPLTDAAVATSSTLRRAWMHGGQAAHHLIDPRSGKPATTNLVSVSVVARALPDAEIHAKAALILGEEQGLADLAKHDEIAALLVCSDGRERTCGAFEEKAYGAFANFHTRFAAVV